MGPRPRGRWTLSLLLLLSGLSQRGSPFRRPARRRKSLQERGANGKGLHRATALERAPAREENRRSHPAASFPVTPGTALEHACSILELEGDSPLKLIQFERIAL